MSKSKFLAITAVVFTIILTICFGIQTLILLTIWYALGILAHTTSANSKQRFSIFIITLLYPIVEGLIKLSISKNIIPGSWIFINRIEHGLFSFITTYIIYVIVKNLSLTINKYMGLITSLLLLNLFGVFNEIYEYFMRLGTKSISGVTYSDTMIDLVVNLFASAFAVAVIYFLETKHERRKPNNR